MCREEALALSSLKPKLDSQTPPVRLVCIAGEALGHEEFLRDYWKGELYIDEGKQTVFPVVNPTAPSLMAGICSFFCGGEVKQHVNRVKAKNIQGNFKGEGLKLGGTLVVDPTHGLLFEHQERIWGDNACAGKMAELEKAIAKIGQPPGNAHYLPPEEVASPPAH